MGSEYYSRCVVQGLWTVWTNGVWTICQRLSCRARSHDIIEWWVTWSQKTPRSCWRSLTACAGALLRRHADNAVGVDKLECGRTATSLHNHVVIRTFVS